MFDRDRIHLPELLLMDFKSPLLDDKLVFELGVDGVEGFMSLVSMPLLLFSVLTLLVQLRLSLFELDDWVAFCCARRSCFRNFALLF